MVTTGTIYLVRNTISGTGYVGQTVQPVHRRWASHVGDASRFDFPLYRAIRKYGPTAFEVSILETCPAKDLDAREVFWIDSLGTYRNGYNATTGGGSLYFRSVETRHKMSVSMSRWWAEHPGFTFSNESKLKKSLSSLGAKNHFYGRHHSRETKARLSEMMKREKAPNYGRTFSEEHRDRMSKAKLGELNPNYGLPWSTSIREKLTATRAGARNGRAKLDEAQAHAIKFGTEPIEVVSVRYGVSLAIVQRIRRGETWKHLK